MKFSKRTLDNGLRVIVAPMESTETVTLLVLVGTGANYETKANNGISHFLEHMFFKGTKNYPRVGELDRMLDAVGAEHNAFTSRERTGYWIKVDASHFPLAVTFVSEILQNALLKEEEIQKERGVILEEMSMYRDSPQDHVWDVFHRGLYGDHPYGWDVLGTPAHIRTMKRSAFVKYWKSQYVASNTLVVVAGNVSESAAFSKIERAFKSLRTGAPAKEPAPPRIKEKPEAHLFSKETAQSHLVIGVPGFALQHKDRMAAGLLATILGGYMSSRLFSEIREKLGLAYSVAASHSAYKNVGHFAAYAGVPHGKAEEVARRIVSNMVRVKKRGVTSEELSRAKENTKGHLAISLESTDDVAAFLGGQEILLGRIEDPERLTKRIDAVRKEDISRVARSMFKPKSARIALVGPHSDKKVYESILQELAL